MNEYTQNDNNTRNENKTHCKTASTFIVVGEVTPHPRPQKDVL